MAVFLLLCGLAQGLAEHTDVEVCSVREAPPAGHRVRNERWLTESLSLLVQTEAATSQRGDNALDKMRPFKGVEGEVVEVDAKAFQKLQKNQNYLLLSFVSAWCKFCYSTPRIMKKVSGHLVMGARQPELTVGVVDGDKSPALMQLFNVTAYPTYVLTDKEVRTVLGRFVGPRRTFDLSTWVEDMIIAEENPIVKYQFDAVIDKPEKHHDMFPVYPYSGHSAFTGTQQLATQGVFDDEAKDTEPPNAGTAKTGLLSVTPAASMNTETGTAPEHPVPSKASNDDKRESKDGVSAIVYINLDRRTDRREGIEKMLSKYGAIPHFRFAAVETTWEAAKLDIMEAPGSSKFAGLLPEETTLSEYYLKTGNEDTKNFVVSCRLSHMSVWRNIRDGKYGSSTGLVLILEDDANLKDGWNAAMVKATSHMPSDWDVACFDVWGAVHDKDKVFSDDSMDVYQRPKEFEMVGDVLAYGGAHACMMRPSTANNVIHGVNSIRKLGDIDSQMSDGNIKAYTIQTKSGLFRADDSAAVEGDHPKLPILITRSTTRLKTKDCDCRQASCPEACVGVPPTNDGTKTEVAQGAKAASAQLAAQPAQPYFKIGHLGPV